MAGPGRRRLALAGTFAAAAGRYWLGVFPLLERELRHWQRQAGTIPDPALRRHALASQAAERGNLEGAAAFAVLAPRAYRMAVVRASVAFQVAYDYVDSLAEQPSEDPVANGYQLHLALLAALDPASAHVDYYRHSPSGRDGGYIRKLVDACRRALASLPSHQAVIQATLRAARRMIAYQSLNHGAGALDTRALARWARAETPPGTGLRWWETAAGAASSMGVFSLFAAAGRPALLAEEADATADAYFPWIGALHVLLDSLIDRASDRETGHHSLVEHYDSEQEAATRMGSIAARAMAATGAVPQAGEHALILAAMASFYLSAPGGDSGDGAIAQQVLDAMGALATPTMAVLRARRRGARSLILG